jgi:ribonuclease PH
MRVDGRLIDKLRAMIINPNYTAYDKMSVLNTMNDIKWNHNATIEDGISRKMQSEAKICTH